MTSARPPFDEIVRELGPMIRRIAASHEANSHDAEDLTQEILSALWRALPRFRGDSSLRTFVARIATYRAVTHVRRSLARGRAAELPEDLPAPGESPESRLAAREQAGKLLAAVRALPLPLRQAALLALEGLSPSETAAVLGITPNAVAIRMSRARDALRTLMEDAP